METRSWELIAMNEPAVIAKPALDPIVVEDSEGNGCFPDSPCTDESDGFKVFSESGDFLNQFVAPKTGPGPRGR